jgi:FkbM family methyltransferase
VYALDRIRGFVRNRRQSPFRSQVGQDRWVVQTLDGKRGGFFVEIGAADGVELSNTYGLEKALGWSGICIEPNPRSFAKLKGNRRCAAVRALASSEAGRMLTFQLDDALSGVLETAGGMMRHQRETITMVSVTLAQILEQHHAPEVIDYLSLDVEGHEIDVLKGLFPSRFKFRCITIEHNEPHQGPALREAEHRILTANGYRFVKGNDDVHGWGHGPIDDFFVNADPAVLAQG